MAKISTLPVLAKATGNETVPVVSEGATKRMTVGALVAGAVAGASAVTPSSSVTVTTAGGKTNIALTFPQGVEIADGSIIEFRAPSALKGPLTITTEQLGTVAFINRVASPYTGVAFPAYTTVQAQWNAGGSVWGEYATATPLYVAQATDIRANAALLATGLLADAVVASPIDNDPNNVTVDAPNATDGELFNVLAVATNTGLLAITAGGITRFVANGGGIDFVAGDFEAGTVYPLRYSPGGGKFALDGTPFPAREIAARTDADLAEKPWGNVKISSDGVRTVTAINKYLLLTGSSNAHPDYVSASHLPSNVAVQALNEEYAGTGINWIPDNQAEPGAPSAAIPSQVAKSVPYQIGGQVPFHLRFFGMNEIRTIFYASEGGVLQEIDALEASVRADSKRGVTSVLNTIFPPDLRESAVAGDPHWFADTRPFPDGGSTRNQDFPAFKAAPVDPETQMEPRASQMLTGPRDWSGSGILRQGYRRIQHWNELVRALGAKLNVMVLDFEWAAYRNAIETVPDLGAGLNQFYTPGNPLHPKDALYAAAVTPILRQWAKCVRSGRQDVRLFRGQDDALVVLGAEVQGLASAVQGALTDLSYRPTLASAVADFDVGTFFTSRDMDGASAYAGVKRQYQIIAASPFWADRGPWAGPSDIGLDSVDNTRDMDKPVSAAMRTAIATSADTLAGDLKIEIAQTTGALSDDLKSEIAQTTGALADDLVSAAPGKGSDLLGARGFADSESTAQNEIRKLIEKTVSVRDHGATQDDGNTSQHLAFSAAAQATPARVTSTAAFADMPQAPSGEVWVPDGLYHLTFYVDTGGKDITWRCGDGARFTSGSATYLLGKVVRLGRTSSGFPFGALDHACGTSVSVGNGSFDQSPLIGGITRADQVSLPPTFDLTAAYFDATGTALAHQSGATFTATTAKLASPAYTLMLRIGMVVQTTHAPFYRGVLVGWTPDGLTLHVSGWYPAGSTVAGTPANSNAQVLVNVFDKMWTLNANAFLTAAGYTYQATVNEMGIINQKVAPANAEDGSGRTWGGDVVNLGSIKFSIAFIARGPGFEGFRATGVDIGFNSEAFASLGYAAPAIGFNYRGSGTALRQLSAAGTQQVAIANGSIELGDINTPSPAYIDFHSSGGAGVDYDARIIAEGGGGTGNGGLKLVAAEVATQMLKPLADNTYTLGAAGYRWSVVWAATGTISTSDPRLKRFIVDDEFTSKLRRIGARLRKYICAYQWLDMVAAKGDDARIHVGVSAQVVMDEFGAEGLNARDFGLFCEDAETISVATITPVEVPDTEIVEELRPVSEIVDDRIVLTEKLVSVEKPKTKRLPVYKDGVPLMRKRYAEPEFPGGRPIEIGVEEAYEDVPVMRTKDVVTYEDVPTGKTRLGLRYEQLAMLMLAAD